MATGKIREPWLVAVLCIVTVGIYYLFWTYFVFEEVRRARGHGIGGVIGVVFAVFIWPVNLFLLPSDVGEMYAEVGLERPVSGVTGFWNLIPLIGFIIWVVKVQGALNRRWESAAR